MVSRIRHSWAQTRMLYLVFYLSDYGQTYHCWRSHSKPDCSHSSSAERNSSCSRCTENGEPLLQACVSTMLMADSEVTLPMEDLSVAHGFFISNYLQGRGRPAKRPTVITLEADLDVRLHRTALGCTLLHLLHRRTWADPPETNALVAGRLADITRGARFGANA